MLASNDISRAGSRSDAGADQARRDTVGRAVSPNRLNQNPIKPVARGRTLVSRAIGGLLLGLALVLGPVATQALAQAQTNGAGMAPAELLPPLQLKLTAAQADLERALKHQTNVPGATASESVEYDTLLQRLVRTYQFHLADLAAMEAVRQRIQDFKHTADDWTGFSEPPPYSVLMVDELREAIWSLIVKTQAVETVRQMSQKFFDEAKAAKLDSDEKLRRMDEQMEAPKDPNAVTRQTWQRELERARNRLAAASLAMFETKRRLAAEELAENRQRLALGRRQLALVGNQISFSQADLDKVMAGLEAEQKQVDLAFQAADKDLEARHKALAEARENLRLTVQDAPAGSTNAASLQRLRDWVDGCSVQAETAAQALAVQRQMQANLAAARRMWQLRFAVFGTQDLAALQEATRQLARIKDVIQVVVPYYQQQIELAANQITEEQTRLQSQTSGSTDATVSRLRLLSYQQRVEFYLQAMQDLDEHQRFVARWQESIDAERRALPLVGRVQDLFTSASGFFSKLWTFELFTIVDTITVDGQQITGRRGVTVGKVCLALMILVVGYWLTDVISRIIEPIAVSRLKIERNQAQLIRRWVRVVLVIALVVFSLVSVKIPLTVFAFAGGALAIGIGFGTQTMLKNFISGIIILFERPFRVGDQVDVQGQRGTVTTIGIRSSVVQLSDSTETLIPNSVLLENIVTNWTYSNHVVRFTVKVGVAYGSDTSRVAELLGEIAGRHGLVQSEPKPQVLFIEFADNSLNFELRFWVNVVKHNSAQIGSDLRHMIAAKFAEHHIAIAFPQRDVHLDATRPLQVQVMPAPTSSAPPAPEPGHPLAAKGPEAGLPLGGAPH